MFTFHLRDFLMDNHQVTYDLASSSVKSISYPREIQSKFRSSLGYTDKLDRELSAKVSTIYDLDAAKIVLLSGAQVANSITLLTLLNSNDEIIVECPNYQPLVNVPRRLGLDVKKIKRRFEDDFHIRLNDLDDLISKDTKALVITNPHNPSGKYLDRGDMKKIQRYLQEKDILLIVDEIFNGFIDDDFSAINLGENVIVTSSLSKVFGMGGVRIGWVVSKNESFVEKINSVKYDFNLLNSTNSEKLAIDVIENREVLLKKVRTLAERNLSMVTGWIEGNDFFEWVPPTGGIISFPKLKNTCDSITFSRRAIEADVLVAPGKFFSEDDEWNNHIRLCFGIKTGDLAVGLQRLSKVVRK